ncbi:MAG: iron permease FTR1 [Thermoleophilia bacterium]|nr:iron permease FTR1 [Thermoleophilia bacterium]
MRRLALLLTLLAAGAFAAPALASSHDEDQFAEVRARVAEARVLVDQAVAAVEAGDRERAYEIARSAYLDHFELAEVPLRLRDPNLVLDVEFSFAEFRNGIRDGKPVSEIKQSAAEIRSGLVDVDRVLADKGFAAPLLAFAFAFAILFREGVEVVLLLAILLGALAAGKASGYRKPLAGGVIAALAMTAVTWVLATVVLEIAPVQRELLEGVTAVLAAAVLLVVSFWLVSRLDHKHWLEFMRARVASAIAAGSSIAFAGLGFTAVYREGFETVLFYQALAIFAKGPGLYVALGFGAAVLALAIVAYIVLKLGRRVPVKPMLTAGAATLLLLSVTFAGNAVRSLQGADWVAITPVQADWARLPVFLAELTGIHPTREGLTVQAVLLSIYVLGAIWVFAIKPWRRRTAEAVGA